MKKKLRGSPFVKHFTIVMVLLTAVIITYGQNDKSKKGKIQNSGTVNMKELQEKEKHMPPDSLKKKKFDKGPEENTKSKALPVPKNAVIKKSEIKPGKMKQDSTQQKNKKKVSSTGIKPDTFL